MIRQLLGNERVLVVIPVLGHHAMTHALLRDISLESELADVVIVDNGGDYPTAGNEAVLRPGTNLGWAGGTNLGTLEARRPEHVGCVWLNNDTRLSRGFLAGLVLAWRATGAGLLGPFYDCFWRHQQLSRQVAVDRYRPRRLHFRAPFADGTCVFAPSATLDLIGVLDENTFSPVGWGADIDYSLRARAAGLEVVVTRLSYLHHEKSVTGKTVYGDLEGYATAGFPTLAEGLCAKWGEHWQRDARIDPITAQTLPLGRMDRVRRHHGDARDSAG